jgi:polyisoprenoid-binding protein YceI
MTEPAQIAASMSGRSRAGPRRRHWWRWILGGVALLIVLGVAAIAAATALNPGPVALGLPGGAVNSPSGPLAGTWRVEPGSAAAFRVRETVLGLGNMVGGSTGSVTGTVVIAGDQVNTASFGINLTTIRVSGKQQPDVAISLATGRYPEAALALARPVTLPAGFATGRTVTFTAPAEFTLRGVARPVTVTLTARRDGTALQAAGSIPIVFSQFGIVEPAGHGAFGSLADHGTAEFRLVLRRAG